MSTVTPPQQNPEKDVVIARQSDAGGNFKASGGGASGGTIAIGAIMLVAGIGLSAAGTGRGFIGLIVVGLITLVRGLAGR
jgi:hypothetical protein